MLLALFRKFSAPSTIKHSLHSFLSFFSPTQVDSRITSLDRWLNHLRMGLVPPPLLWKVLQVLTFPQGMELVSVSWIMASHDGNWAESLSTWFPALVKFAMGLYTVRCWPVGHFGSVIHLLLFSHEKKLFFLQLLVLAACQPTYASCCYCSIVGWLVMSWSSSASHT